MRGVHTVPYTRSFGPLISFWWLPSLTVELPDAICHPTCNERFCSVRQTHEDMPEIALALVRVHLRLGTPLQCLTKTCKPISYVGVIRDVFHGLLRPVFSRCGVVLSIHCKEEVSRTVDWLHASGITRDNVSKKPSQPHRMSRAAVDDCGNSVYCRKGHHDHAHTNDPSDDRKLSALPTIAHAERSNRQCRTSDGKTEAEEDPQHSTNDSFVFIGENLVSGQDPWQPKDARNGKENAAHQPRQSSRTIWLVLPYRVAIHLPLPSMEVPLFRCRHPSRPPPAPRPMFCGRFCVGPARCQGRSAGQMRQVAQLKRVRLHLNLRLPPECRPLM